MIDFDAIRKDAAIKYGVLVDKDDPVLAYAAMFETTLMQCLGELNSQQEANLKALLIAIQQGTAETKATAGRVVTQGTEYACDQLHNAIKATMDEGREELRKDIRLAWNKIEEARKAAVFAAAISTLCTVVIGAAMLNVF